MNDDDSSASKPTIDDSPLASERRIVHEAREVTAGRYVTGAEIGRGGMGRVVEATDRDLGRVVAVKEALATDPDMLRRFARETKITARLEHPSIVPVYDAGTAADGSPFYVMRKVSGKPLAELVEAASALDQHLALVPHVLAAAHAIGHAHGRGIIHRDLKPANILVGHLGETVVIDWGLAKVVDDPDDPDDPDDAPTGDIAGNSMQTRIGAVVGTPGFMAPEQLRGDPADRRCDVYALGATLFYVLAHRPPHHAGSGTEMMAAAAKAPAIAIATLVDGLPPELATIVDKALAYDSAERYPDAGAFAADLQQFLTGQLVASHRYSTRERVLRFVRRNRIAVATITIALLALAVGGAFAVRRIVAERDRADVEARLATQRLREAEAAEARARDRNDQLLLAQARALLATNPTAAVATVKQLAADPARWATTWRQARAIAAEARRAGVARELPGPVEPRALAMSPNGMRVAVAGDGVIHGYEMGARTHRVLAKTTEGTSLAFADDNRLVTTNKTRIQIIDWDTTRQREHPISSLRDAAVTANHVAWIDDAYEVWWMKLVDGVPAKLAGGEAQLISASSDGKIALSSAKRLALVELGDRPLVRDVGSGEAISLAFSADGAVLAAGYRDHLERIDLPAATNTRFPTPGIPLGLAAKPTQVMFVYNGIAYTTHGTKAVPLPRRTVEWARGLHPVSRGRIVGSFDNRLLVFDDDDTLDIYAPTEATVRILGRASAPYIVAPIRGHLLYWNTDDLKPPSITIADGVASYARVGRHDFLVWSVDGVWRWIDRAAGTTRAVFHGFASGELAPSPVHPRAAFLGAQQEAFTIERAGPPIQIRGKTDRLMFMADGKLLIAAAGGQLISLDADTKTRVELYARPGTIHSLGTRGSWVAALYTDGHVWRRDLASGRAQTFPGTPPPDSIFRLPVFGDGTLLFPDGNKLTRWDAGGTSTTHATLPGPILSLAPVANRVLAGTIDGSGYIVDPDLPDHVSAGIAGGTTSRVHFGDSPFGVVESSGGVRILDVDSGQTWPVFHRGYRRFMRAPRLALDGRWLTAMIRNQLLEWPIDIPETADATRAWLDELTNATAELGPATMSWHHATKR